jgi:flagellar biogenesis protein FliO
MEASTMRREYDFWSEFTHMLSILAAIILFLLGAAWVMRRLLNVRMESINQNSHIRIIERRTMSPKSAIYLLEVGEQQMLVGESAAGLHPLGTLKENVDSQPEPGLSFAETMDRRTAQGGSEDAS